MDCSLPGSSVHGVFQARVLEWGAITFSDGEQYRGSSKNKKIELLYDPAIPLQDIHRDKTIIQKDTCIPMFIAALYKIAKTWK